MIRALGASLVLAAALGGCAPTPAHSYRELERMGREYQTEAPTPHSAEEATQMDTCGIARFRYLIGALASNIDRATLPAGARIISPDMMVTQDFAPGRLNIMTGTDGRVSSLRCF